MPRKLKTPKELVDEAIDKLEDVTFKWPIVQGRTVFQQDIPIPKELLFLSGEITMNIEEALRKVKEFRKKLPDIKE